MQTALATTAYKQAVQNGAQMVITAQAISATGAKGPMLPITDGTVTYDFTAATRRTCQLAISDPLRTLVPELATDVIAPYGQRIRVYMGPVGIPIPMGDFWIDEVDADDQGSTLDISIKGFDQSGKIAREALTAVYTIAAGTNTGTAIQALLNSVTSGLTFSFSPTSYSTPKTILDLNQDPWAAAVQLATSAGMDLFFDRLGVCVMRPIPDPNTLASSWTYSDNNTDGYGHMIDELTKVVVSSNTIFNDVIVTGETTGTTAVYTGRAQDTNPSSPTYINGPFGDIPIFFKSSILTSNAQAQAIANQKLIYYTGRASQVTLIGPPNPCQDEEDVVKIVRSALSINSKYTIDKIEWGLAPAGANSTKASATGTQTLTARKVVAGS